MEQEQLLEGLLDLVSTKKNADDLIKAVEEALLLVEAIRDANDAERADIKERFNEAIKSIRSYNEERWAKIQERVDALVKGKDGKDGKDGRDGIDGRDGERGENGLDGKDGKDGSPDTPEQVMEKVNNTDAPLIKLERIEGLEAKLKKAQTTTIAYQRGGVMAYDLSPSLDGVTKTFSLPNMWRIISVHSSSFPNAFRENVDFTWTNTSITFTSEIDAASTLATGQTITIIYATP